MHAYKCIRMCAHVHTQTKKVHTYCNSHFMLVLCCYFLLILACWCPIRLVYTISFLFSLTCSADIHMLVYNSNGLCCFVSLLKFSYSLCCHILLSLHHITSKTNNYFLSISIRIVSFSILCCRCFYYCSSSSQTKVSKMDYTTSAYSLHLMRKYM